MGDNTLPATMALAFASAGTLGALVFWRLFNNTLVVCGFFVALFCPTVLISTTHGKEDLLAVALVMGSALLLTRSNLVWAAVGSGVFGLALMTKESVVLVSPFVFGVALVSTVGSDTGGSLVGVGQIRRGAARILLILAASL